MSKGGKGIMKKILISIVLVSMFIFSSCIKSDSDEEAYTDGEFLMVVDKSEMCLVKVPYEIKAQNDEEIINELLDALVNYKNEKYASPIYKNVNLNFFEFNESTLSVYFDEGYYELGIADETLVRAAVVSTLCQITSVDDVLFYVGESELMVNGRLVGRMNRESFIYDMSVSEAEAIVTLYFPDINGEKLHKVIREVSYDSMYTDEQIVIEELIKGTDNEELSDSVPKGTKLINIVTKNMICYVNFSNSFTDGMDGISDSMIVYSVVNSLSELPGVSSVVISVDGVKIDSYRTMNCVDPLVSNYDMVDEDQK